MLTLKRLHFADVILRSGLVGTFCGIALVMGLSTSCTTEPKSSEHPINAQWSREQQIVSFRMWTDFNLHLRASEHVLSLSLFHTPQVRPPSKQSPFVSRHASRCRFSLPRLHSLRSLCSPYRSFRRLTSHPALPHFPPQCVLCTVNFGISGVDD